MQPANGSQRHYLYEVTLTLHKLFLAINFPCDVTASLKRAHRKYPLKSNHTLDTQKYKCDFGNSTITYQAVFTVNSSAQGAYDVVPDIATVYLMLVTPKGNKSAGQFEIAPTSFLADTLDPALQKELKSSVEKCPDKKAGVVYSLNLKRLKQLSQEEYLAEMAKNPDVTMEGGESSFMSQMGPGSSSFNRGAGSAINTSSTAVNPSSKILSSDIRLDGNRPIPNQGNGQVPVPQPIVRPNIPIPVNVSQSKPLTPAPIPSPVPATATSRAEQNQDLSRDEGNPNRSGSKTRAKGNVTMNFERKPPTSGVPAPQTLQQPLPQQAPQQVTPTPPTVKSPIQTEPRAAATARPIEVTPFQTPGGYADPRTVESTKTQAFATDKPIQQDGSGNGLENAQLRAQVAHLRAQLDEANIKYDRDLRKALKDQDESKIQLDKLYDERAQWNAAKRDLLLKSDEVVSLKEQLLQLQGKHSGPHPDSTRLAQTLSTLSAVQKENDRLQREVQQLDDERKAAKQTAQTLQERLKEQASSQTQRESALTASYTAKIGGLESQMSAMQAALVNSQSYTEHNRNRKGSNRSAISGSIVG